MIYCDPCSKWRLEVPEFDLHDARTCEICYDFFQNKVPMLLRGSPFLLFTAGNDKLMVDLSVTRDFGYLSIHEAGDLSLGRRAEESSLLHGKESLAGEIERVPLDAYQTWVDGQQTPIFNKYKPGFFSCFSEDITQYETDCFSLVFGGSKTVDLRSMDERGNSRAPGLKKRWGDAWKELMRRKVTGIWKAFESVQAKRVEIESERQAQAARHMQQEVERQHQEFSMKRNEQARRIREKYGVSKNN